MYLFKSSSSRTLHEPTFKHKKRILVPKYIDGLNCLIDIFKIIKSLNEIHLYECKADLNNFIKKKKKPKFIVSNDITSSGFCVVQMPVPFTLQQTVFRLYQSVLQRVISTHTQAFCTETTMKTQ